MRWSLVEKEVHVGRLLGYGYSTHYSTPFEFITLRDRHICHSLLTRLTKLVPGSVVAQGETPPTRRWYMGVEPSVDRWWLVLDHGWDEMKRKTFPGLSEDSEKPPASSCDCAWSLEPPSRHDFHPPGIGDYVVLNFVLSYKYWHQQNSLAVQYGMFQEHP